MHSRLNHVSARQDWIQYKSYKHVHMSVSNNTYLQMHLALSATMLSSWQSHLQIDDCLIVSQHATSPICNTQ